MLQPYNEDQNRPAYGAGPSAGSVNEDPPPFDGGSRVDDDRSLGTDKDYDDDEAARKRFRCILFGIVVVALLAIAAIVVPLLLDNCDCPDNDRSLLTAPPVEQPAPTPAPVVPVTAAPVVPPTNAPTFAPTTSAPTRAPSASPSVAPTSVGVAQIIENVGIPVSGEAAFQDRSGPQFRAAEFLVTDAFSAGGGITTVEEFAERYALTVFYYALGGDDWNTCSQTDDLCPNTGTWLSTERTHCRWLGITCNDQNLVTSIQFSSDNGNGIAGELPEEIGALSSLQTLTILNDGVTGSFPDRLNELTALRELVMTNNELDGPIPSDFLAGSAATMQRIYLGNNNIRGSIPSSFGQFVNVVELFLQGNNLNGVIPAELSQMGNLGRLNLANNNLRGELTSGVYLPGIEELDLSDNPNLRDTLSGESLAGMSFLNRLKLGGTGIGGQMPTELFNLPLIELDVEGAEFTGPLPTGIANLEFSVRIINLANNFFSGPFTDVFDDLSLLNELQVEGNDLTGTVSEQLCARRGDGRNQISVLSSDCTSEIACSCCTQCF